MRQQLDAFLFSTKEPLLRYCIKAFLLAAIVSLSVLCVALLSLVMNGTNLSSLSKKNFVLDWPTVVGMLLFAPIAETVFLGINLTIFKSFSSHKYFVAGVTAVLWGIGHAFANGYPAFFGTSWSFFVFSCAYLNWRSISYKHAFIAAAVPHFLINCLAIAFAYIENFMQR